jgi:hypothetical protein
MTAPLAHTSIEALQQNEIEALRAQNASLQAMNDGLRRTVAQIQGFADALLMPDDDRASFTCPRCSRTSHHPEDAAHGYCGACHAYTGDTTP